MTSWVIVVQEGCLIRNDNQNWLLFSDGKIGNVITAVNNNSGENKVTLKCNLGQHLMFAAYVSVFKLRL